MPPFFKFKIYSTQDANSALQESIGDAIYLGIMTPQHLNRIRLLPDKYLFPDKLSPDSDNIDNRGKLMNKMVESNITIFGNPVKNLTESKQHNDTYNNKLDNSINAFDITLLLQMALMKIPQIPFEYILDIFRWDLFNGNVSFANANEYFWQLSVKHQGIHPPGWLNRKDFFDPGAKFHVADNTPFVRYKTQHIIRVKCRTERGTFVIEAYFVFSK